MPRLLALTFGIAAIVIGVVITALPWQELWTSNSLVDGYPAIRELLMNNFVRGLISGLGVVDIWIGVSEIFDIRKNKR